MITKWLSIRSFGWKRNSPADLVNLPSGLRLLLEDEKARGQRQKDMKGLAGLDVKCWGTYTNLHTEPLLIVCAYIWKMKRRRQQHKDFSWEAVLSFKLQRKD